MDFQRMWINAPSTNQVVHHYNGQNVLVMVQGDGKTLEPDGKDANYVKAAFVHTNTISIRIHKMYLSKGWNKNYPPYSHCD